MKKLVSCALAFMMLVTCVTTTLLATHAEEPSASPSADMELYLYLGSPIAMSDGKILPLDKNNPDLVPLLHKDRTLVPLRFISEFFGAAVDYDAAAHAGIVKIGDKTAVFPVGESYFTLNGKKVAIDTETLEIGGRIFLPLRAIGEQVFSIHVDYKNEVIFLSQKEASLTDAKALEVKGQIGAYVKVPTLAELKTYFKANDNSNTTQYVIDKATLPVPTAEEAASGDMALAPTAAPAPMEPAAANEAPAADAGSDQVVREMSADQDEYSATNTQVEGVDEADIIKTDGKFIYLLGGSTVKIVSAGETMSLAGKLELGSDRHASDMYVDGDRLVLIGTRYEQVDYPTPRDPRIMYEDIAVDIAYPYYGSSFTFAEVYDISDKSDIALLRTFEIEGYVTATRKQGDYLYLASNLSVWSRGEDPRPFMGENGKILPMPIDDIMIAPGCPAEQFLTLSAINIKDSEEAVESETIADGGGTTYMSNNAMYIAGYSYQDNGEFLSIAKFTVDEGRIGYAGSGKVKGYLNDQFSMDESKGYLRVATTVWDDKNSNNLYVLDGNMQVCGSVKNFAPDESIYSVRFMGDKGYIVTFRQMDPLFVFDLSNPENPVITGELKVPGFSSYLHPVAEDVILGIGNDVYDIYAKDKNGREVVVGQRTGGIKLSLFDVSDMGKPREIDTLILGDGGYAELLYNHKAAMFKQSESLLGFTANLNGFDKDDSWNGALLISYAGNSLRELGRIDSERGDYWVDSTEDSESYFYFGERLVYIGNTLYYAEGDLIRSFDLGNLKEIQSLKLR